jgi:tetratricopeptide (TPR) repeat protein
MPCYPSKSKLLYQRFGGLKNTAVERRGVLYAISAPIHDAIRRDKRFGKPEDWRKNVALKIIDSVSQYQEDDQAPVALMEAAALASIISGKSQTLVARYVLPSYYLTLAQRAYDNDRYPQAIEFCKRAWDRNSSLSVEGRIETLRLWGISAARLRDEDGLNFALAQLDAFRAKRIARRHGCFLKGFSARLRRRLDEAEQHFLSAYKLAPKNMSINRELANLYRHQQNFVEGEGYARAAHQIAPTNPFIIDVLLECLLGKAAADHPVNQAEIEDLLRDLSKYGDVPGSSFYQTRIAHDLFRKKDRRAALTSWQRRRSHS